jgi:AcrR family transcriptional regulator
VGLRERKKEQTRQVIADTAWRLFADRGFDRVAVAEVADEAQVAVATVFNYFPTKEDLFFFRLEAYGARMLEAVRSRPPGEPVLVAVRRFLLQVGGLLEQIEAGDLQALERLRTFHRVVAASPALQAREQQAIARLADALAGLLAAEAGPVGDHATISAHVAANALLGVHRTMIGYVRRRVLADEAPDRLAADVRSLYQQAFALLERGLDAYAAKPPPAPHGSTPPLPAARGRPAEGSQS